MQCEPRQWRKIIATELIIRPAMILRDYYMTIVKLLIIQCKVQDAAEKFVMPIIIVTLLMLTI